MAPRTQSKNPHEPPQGGENSSDGQVPGMSPVPTESVAGLYVATTTFATEIDGVPTIIHRDKDHVREGHELLRNNPQNFKPVELGVTYDVERATAAPGEKRGA